MKPIFPSLVWGLAGVLALVAPPALARPGPLTLAQATARALRFAGPALSAFEADRAAVRAATPGLRFAPPPAAGWRAGVGLEGEEPKAVLAWELEREKANPALQKILVAQAALQEQTASAEERAHRLTIAAEVRRAFLQAQSAQALAQAEEAPLAALRELARVLGHKVDQGQAPALSLKLAQAQIKAQQSRVALAQGQTARFLTTLFALMGEAPPKTWPALTPLALPAAAPPPADLLRSLNRRDPDAQQLALAARRAQLAVAAAQAAGQSPPTVTWEVEAEQTRDGDLSALVNVGLRRTLGLGPRAAPQVAAARHALLSAQQRLSQHRRWRQREARRAWADWQAAAAPLAAYDTLLPAMRENLALGHAAYKLGHGGLEDLLAQSREYAEVLREAAQARAEALLAYGDALAALSLEGWRP